MSLSSLMRAFPPAPCDLCHDCDSTHAAGTFAGGGGGDDTAATDAVRIAELTARVHELQLSLEAAQAASEAAAPCRSCAEAAAQGVHIVVDGVPRCRACFMGGCGAKTVVHMDGAQPTAGGVLADAAQTSSARQRLADGVATLVEIVAELESRRRTKKKRLNGAMQQRLQVHGCTRCARPWKRRPGRTGSYAAGQDAGAGRGRHASAAEQVVPTVVQLQRRGGMGQPQGQSACGVRIRRERVARGAARGAAGHERCLGRGGGQGARR